MAVVMRHRVQQVNTFEKQTGVDRNPGYLFHLGPLLKRWIMETIPASLHGPYAFVTAMKELVDEDSSVVYGLFSLLILLHAVVRSLRFLRDKSNLIIFVCQGAIFWEGDDKGFGRSCGAACGPGGGGKSIMDFFSCGGNRAGDDEENEFMDE